MSKTQAKHKVAAGGLVVMLVVTVAFLYAGVLGRSLTERPITVEVELEETGGLFEGSAVTYRGVRIGEVERIEVEAEGVVAYISIARSPAVSADAVAVVRSLSPAGEQYLDLQPETEGGTALAGGDRIHESRTPTSVADTLRSVDGLMASIDPDNLEILLTELHAATREPEVVERLVEASDTLLIELEALWPQTEQLIRDGRVLLRMTLDYEDDLRQMAGDISDAAEVIAFYDPQIRQFVTTTPERLEATVGFIDMVSDNVGPTLANLGMLLDILIAHDPHFRELLARFPQGVATLTSAFGPNELRVDMIMSPQLVCGYGEFPSHPRSTNRTEVTEYRDCVPQENTSTRGSGNAPGPAR